MKISVISAAWPYRGGIANFTSLLYKELIKEHEVNVYTFTRQYPDFLFPGKTQLETEKSSLEIPALRTIDSINPVSWVKTGRAIKKERPDFLIIKYWMPFFAPAFGTIARIVRSNKHTKVVGVCHNVIPHEKKPGDISLTRFLFNKTDKFVILSNAVENDLKKVKADADYKVLYHPVYSHFGEIVNRDKACENIGITQPGRKNLLFFGFIREYKGLDILIRACGLLKDKLDFNLIIAGEFYSDEDKYHKLIKENHLGERVVLRNDFIPSDDVKNYFSASDVVVLPYRSATQSGIIQAAYNFYKPVIVTKTGALTEIVTDGKTGYTVEPENPEKLADAILKYFNENKADEFSGNIKTHQEQFSWKRFSELFTNYLQK